MRICAISSDVKGVSGMTGFWACIIVLIKYKMSGLDQLNLINFKLDKLIKDFIKLRFIWYSLGLKKLVNIIDLIGK